MSDKNCLFRGDLSNIGGSNDGQKCELTLDFYSYCQSTYGNKDAEEIRFIDRENFIESFEQSHELSFFNLNRGHNNADPYKKINLEGIFEGKLSNNQEVEGFAKLGNQLYVFHEKSTDGQHLAAQLEITGNGVTPFLYISNQTGFRITSAVGLEENQKF